VHRQLRRPNVTMALRWEAMVNRTYADMAALGHRFLSDASLLAT